MDKYFKSDIGRLRFLGILEGSSLLILLFIAMPIKYLLDNPVVVEYVGSIHGVLFLLFVFYTLWVAYAHKWKLFHPTAQVLASSIIPFGTFYVDRKILKHLDA